MFALMAVQRQAAASRSASPESRLQQGVFGGVPTTRWTKPFSKFAHTPNLRASLGQAGTAGWEWPGTFGFMGGQGVREEGMWVELTKEKRMMRLKERSNAADARDFGAMIYQVWGSLVGLGEVAVTKKVEEKEGLYSWGKLKYPFAIFFFWVPFSTSCVW